MTTGTVEDLPKVEEQPTTFSEYVQCDSCGVARAMWKIVGNSGVLYLCGHHKNKFEVKLASWGEQFLEFTEES